MGLRTADVISTKNDGINDLGFPRKISYKVTKVTSDPSEWKRELNEELRVFLEQNPELRKLPMRADSYTLQIKMVGNRKKYFAVLTYMGNGPLGPTQSNWMKSPSTNGTGDEHLTSLGDLPPERSGRDDYNNPKDLDSFAANG